MRKFLAFSLSIVVSISTFSNVFAMTEATIFSDPVENTYIGRAQATDTILNLQFTDLPEDDSQRESIIRIGALDIVKGYDQMFDPQGEVSIEEALAFVIRTIGGEEAAKTAAVTASALAPPDSPLRTHWALGYLNVSMQLGLIGVADYTDALRVNQEQLNPDMDFVREFPATRQQFADWLVRGLETINAEIFNDGVPMQTLYTFADYEEVNLMAVRAMEALTKNRILANDGTGYLRPQAPITRAEVVQTIKNLDGIFYEINGLEKKAGTIGGIRDAQSNSTGTAAVARNMYVRLASGGVDILQYRLESTTSPQLGETDAVVFKDGEANSLVALREGDELEYLVRTATNEIIYAQVTSKQVNRRTVQGILQAVDVEQGIITINDNIEMDAKSYTYPMVGGLYGTDSDGNANIIIDERRHLLRNIPIGSILQITLENDVATDLNYIGEPEAYAEMRGIIVENNPNYGFLTFFDNNGNLVTKNYYENDILVEKQHHYLTDDEVGYLNQVFDLFTYDPRTSTISQVEPGDIVFMRFDPQDPNTIVAISAGTDYVVRYGKIMQFNTSNGVSTMLVEYENGRTSWFDVANEIFMSKAGRPIEPADIVVGDWARLLVNQAIVGPGHVLESVKEISIENSGHMITDIIKGQLAGINSIQNILQIQNAQSLTHNGWANHTNVSEFSLKGRDIELFHNGRQISLDYADRYLKRSNGEVYVALENNFTGDQVRKVTFRDGRDELIRSDSVLDSDGNGNFTVLNVPGTISTDSGTIVRRLGRLVDGRNIASSDYAAVSLNGGNNAAIVDINQAPDSSGVMIVRGRILSVDEGRTFDVQSMSTLTGVEWMYSPIQREFTIDYNTMFMTANGIVNRDTFIDYTELSVANRVYNIITDGSRASHVIDSPFANQAIRGTVYGVEGAGVLLKDTQVYDDETGQWSLISNVNSASVVVLPLNSIVVESNSVIRPINLKIGQQVRIMTNQLPEEITGGMVVVGHIAIVER